MKADFIDRDTIMLLPENMAEEIALASWVPRYSRGEAFLRAALPEFEPVASSDEPIEGEYIEG